MILGRLEDILLDIGAMLKAERLYQNLSQQEVAERSAISLSALKHLESGEGANLSSFIQVCRTLRKDDWIMRLGPSAPMSPADCVRRPHKPPRQRAGRSSH